MADYYVTRKSNGDVYNVYPSALGSEELRIDLPEIKVTAPKRLYYANSAYGPYKLNSIKFTPNPRKFMYEAITPLNYDIPKVIWLLGKRALGMGRPTDDNGNYTDVDRAADLLWAMYTRLPIKGELLFEPTDLRPTTGNATYNTVMRYKYPEKIFNEQDILKLLDKEARGEKPSMVVRGDGKGMGSYTLSLGKDKDGRKYASYYDDWDLNIFKGINSFKPLLKVFDTLGLSNGDMGKAFGLNPLLITYYDRKYLEDRKPQVKIGNNWVDLEPQGDGVLTAGNKQFKIDTHKLEGNFKKGGVIHIKKYQNPSGPLKPAQVYLNGKWVNLESHGDGNLSAGGRLFKVKTKPTSATGSREVVITPKGATSLPMTKDEGHKNEYRSSYHPEDAISFINTLTLGGLNNLSPTLWVRRAYDTKELLSGNMDWSNYTNSWINGNNGVVSDLFAKKHPYWSAGINLVGDAAALGGISGIKKLTNISKPNVSVTANIGTTAEQKIPALSLEQIEKAFELARLWHLNRINSPGYTNRALRAGFTEEEIPLLQLQLTSLINRLKLLNPEKLFEKVNMKHNYNGKVSAGYWKTINNEGKLLLGIKFDNPNMSYDDAVSTFVHEFGHGATFGLNGNETTGYMKLLSDLFPLLTKAVKYNKTLYPEVNENIVTQVMPKVGNNAGYYADPTEMLSRGYEFMRDYANNFFKLKNSEGLTTQKVIDNAANTRINSKIFRALTGNLGAFNFLKYALGTAIPIGLGYGLMNNNENQLQLQYLKQGGKMNVLDFLKNGSGIHIKKKNRGKFTDYCGGKVTNECIRRGKNSSNPVIRKRATFADNARHFKH